MSKTTPSTPTMRAYRWRVASRVLAAVLGGYAVTSLATAVLARALARLDGGSMAGAVLGATLLSFTLYTGLVLWIFSTRSATRAWIGLAASAGVLGVLLAALRAAT